MSLTTKSITREELYELVWDKPTCQVSKGYGVSDSAVAKWCIKMEVPKPPRGYWAKIQASLPVKKAPLKPVSPKGAGEVLVLCNV